MLPSMMYCFTRDSKATWPSDLGSKLLKLWAQIHLSSFKMILSGILSQWQKTD
jgi:hypothetical protein